MGVVFSPDLCYSIKSRVPVCFLRAAVRQESMRIK